MARKSTREFNSDRVIEDGDTQRHRSCLCVPDSADQHIQGTFYLAGADEMNWVTEFLDSQFFSHNETEHLFRLMNARNDARGQNTGRFRVDFHHWQPRHADILVFSFTPTRPQKS